MPTITRSLRFFRDRLTTPMLLAVIGLLLLHIHAVNVRADLTVQAATQRATQVINDINAVAPVVSSVQQGEASIHAAGIDPAAIISATAGAISQTAQAAQPVTPPQWQGYLLLVSILANFVQSIFASFKHTETAKAGITAAAK